MVLSAPGVEPTIDRLVTELYDAPSLGPYWPKEKELVDQGYAMIPLPLREIKVEPFAIEERWAWARFEKYLRTWPAVANSAADPLASAFVTDRLAALAAAWGTEDAFRSVCWKLRVRASVKDA